MPNSFSPDTLKIAYILRYVCLGRGGRVIGTSVFSQNSHSEYVKQLVNFFQISLSIEINE